MTGIVKTSAEKQGSYNTSSNARVSSENKNFFPAIYNQGIKYVSTEFSLKFCFIFVFAYYS